MNTRKTLVIGAGAGGIRAALDLAATGRGVILAEQSWKTGGLLSKLDVQFPNDTCGFCRLLPGDLPRSSQHCLRRGLHHERIDLRLGTTLVSLEGTPGAFTAALARETPWVDPLKCIGCGICETVCEEEVSDPFNEGLTRRRAISLQSPQAFAAAYVIDPDACTGCGECEAVCPAGAVSLHAGGRGMYRILVVDDEAVLRDSMREWLTLEGFSVVTAGSGEDALSRLSEAPFHLMLTDIKMPGMDGVVLLERAKDIHPDLTVIMMTAYAEVESAVAAMKEGALDYVTKPFEPEAVVDRVRTLFGEFRENLAEKEEVDAVILATGTGFVRPDREIFGYGKSTAIVTALEFERMLSPTGPGLPKDAQRIAFLQCVGSRDRDHGYCSSACCMVSLKQAVLARSKLSDAGRTDIFYMDLRTPGKTFDTYREEAERAGVNLIRSRIHSLAPVEGQPLTLRYALPGGGVLEEPYDLVVLAAGQELNPGSRDLIQVLDLETDAWGFVRTPALFPHGTSRPGIFTAGIGFKNIESTVILAGAAAMAAALIRMEEGRTGAEPTESQNPCSDGAALWDAAPRVQVVICACDRLADRFPDTEAFRTGFSENPAVVGVEFTDDLCTPEGAVNLVAKLTASRANRLVVGACVPRVTQEALKGGARAAGLPLSLVRGVDLLSAPGAAVRGVGRAVCELCAAQPCPAAPVASFSRALVVGGGIAGMTAALDIAEAGFEVDLVEASHRLGGHLNWIYQTAEGEDTGTVFSDLTEAVTAHDRIGIHLSCRVAESCGRPGRWTTTLESAPDDSAADAHPGEERRIAHGVVVLATGGRERESSETGNGIYTQKAFQVGLDEGSVNPSELTSLVMVQCRDCRTSDRNYCSRICCPRALSQALRVVEKNPGVRVFVLYRDMMTPGSLESLYTRARKVGVIFIPHTPEHAPEIYAATGEGGTCRVICEDPFLGQGIEIEASAVVLATGVTPNPPGCFPFPMEQDPFGFFNAADPKWRPVEGLQPRVFSCGLALSPCDLSGACATAHAAAVRAVGVLSASDRPARARVKPALCSLCQTCIPACPSGARYLDEEENRIVVDGLACQGCGICASVCPSKAARVDGTETFLSVIGLACAG